VGVLLALRSGSQLWSRSAPYRSYYVPRPTVPVESGSHVLPPPDTGTVGAVAEARKEEAAKQNFARRDAAGSVAMAAPMGMPAAPPPPRIEAATAAEEPTQIAFTAPYKVNVAAGQSLVLPLLDRDLPARRVDLY